MKIGRPRVLVRGAASDLWRNTLSQIPSAFGRLVYLSSLRGTTTGRYEHHGLALVFGEEQSDRALRRSHEESFQEWLGYSLEQQKGDLDLYLSELGSDRRTLVETWTKLTPYRNLVPLSCLDADKQLFLADLELLLELLKYEFGGDEPGRDA